MNDCGFFVWPYRGGVVLLDQSHSLLAEQFGTVTTRVVPKRLKVASQVQAKTHGTVGRVVPVVGVATQHAKVAVIATPRGQMLAGVLTQMPLEDIEDSAASARSIKPKQFPRPVNTIS